MEGRCVMGKIIMTVDDSASVRQMVGFTLRDAGYEVLEASDGRDALNKLSGKTVQMVITDLNMPNLDGIGLIRALRGQAGLQIHPDRHADDGIANRQEAGRKSGRSDRLDHKTLQAGAACWR